MSESPVEPLRQAVLSGRFTGQHAAASVLAGMLASSRASDHLRLWFGDEWLRALSAEPDPPGVLRAAIDRDITALDRLASAQLDAILHHPRLTRLEGSWRGLAWLVDRLPGSGSRVRLKLLQARWAEVCRDIERALEFDQSHLFRKVHEEEFGMAGGEPFGLIAADFEVRHRPDRDHPTDDIGALNGLASVAASAFAPIVLGAAPELLGLDSFADMTASFDPSVPLKDTEHQRWRQAASREDLRFVGILLPRVLGRAPWPDDGSRADRFRFRPHNARTRDRVWTSPVYGFAAVALRAFEQYGWPAEVRGAGVDDVAHGGVLEDLPFERFHSDLSHEPPPRAPLEVALTDLQENQFSEARMIPLSALEGLAEACFGALPSMHQPPRLSTAIGQANQRISAQINTMLCVSRFAHCVKLMGRDMTGSFQDPSDIEMRLQRWLDGFISGGSLSSLSETARYPLQEARVEVRERRGRPGVFNCTIHLKPHHQLDEIGASFRLVTEFAPGQATA